MPATISTPAGPERAADRRAHDAFRPWAAAMLWIGLVTLAVPAPAQQVGPVADVVAPPVQGPPADEVTPAAPKKKRDILVAPVPLANPATGAGLAVGALLFYNPNDEPRQWQTVVGGVYTTRGTKGVAGFHNMSFGKDRLRVAATLSFMDVRNKYYGIGEDAGDRGEILGLAIKQFNLQVQALHRIFPHGYAGVRYRLLTSDGESQDPATATLAPPPDDELNSTMSVIGPSFAYDTRDSSMQPHRGTYLNAVWLFGIKALGDSFSHDKLRIAANGYFPLSERTVLAVRGSACSAGGDAPYYDLCLFGSSNDLRGYPSGRYRDGASWAVQGEVRRHIKGRWGAVAFFGLGGIAPSLGGLFDDGNLLPAGGVGVRYRPFKANDVQLRVDVAAGKNDHGIYVGIAEAF